MKYTDRQPPVTLICPHCRQNFTVLACYYRRKLVRNKHLYCSADCSRNHRWGGNRSLIINCEHCGKPKQIQMWQKLRRSGRIFCNNRCASLWQSEHCSGPNSNGWKGGVSHTYGRRDWKKTRQRIRKRDKYTCQGCGRRWRSRQRHFDVHHIRPFDLFEDPEKANADSNLITMCRRCHMRFHKPTGHKKRKGLAIRRPEGDKARKEPDRR